MAKIYGIVPVKVFGVVVKKIMGVAMSILIDHSTPVTVVGSAYDISGNGGRKIVRLSNGWIVTCESSGSTLYFHVSKDNGSTWAQLCYWTTGRNIFAITSYGNMVYCLANITTATDVYIVKFDASTVTNTNLTSIMIDSAQVSMGAGCSIECDSATGYLYATWCSKNAALPNSTNIRHAMSTDGGITWTKANGTAGIDQITTLNVSTVNYSNPCLVIKSGKPIILIQVLDGANYQIINIRYSASWSFTGSSSDYVYNGGTYVQLNSSAVVSPDGVIHVSWMGKDATDTAKFNMRYSKSTDGGGTWSAMDKRTSGNTYDQQYPSISADNNNNIYIEWQGRSSGLYDQIRKMVYSGSWGSTTDLTTNTTANAAYPQTLSNYTNFTDPLCIYQDNQAISIKFRGVWNQ